MTKCSKCDRNPVKGGNELCQKCSASDSASANGATNGPTLVNCELLAYAFKYIHVASTGSMAKVISDFYSAEDIVDAMKNLSNAFSSNEALGEEIKRTKRTTATSGLSDANRFKLADDLINKGVKPLSKLKDPEVIFCAVDLDKVPKFKPEEANIHSLLLRIQNLEINAGRMDALETKCLTNAADIKHLMTGYPMGGAAQGGARPKTPYIAHPPPSSPLATSGKDVSSAPMTSWNSATSLPPASYAAASAVSQDKTLPSRMPDTGRWQVQREERRRLLQDANHKMKVVTGRKTGSNIKAAGINRSIYLSKVDKDYSEDDIKSLMATSNVPVKYIRQINGRSGLGLKKSFMIVIPENDFNTVMSEEFWPVGLECREWLSQDQLKAIVSTSENQSTQHNG
jgi:hypothetical protein